jgi:glutathione S-transferase
VEKIVFYHNPMSRGQIVHWMLEESGAEYETKIIDFATQEHKGMAYMAINPMGKIPSITYKGTVVTECAAICAFLADLFPGQNLAPAIGQPERGTYLRWLFFAAACLESAIYDKAFPRVAKASTSSLGYGSYEDTLNTIEGALRPGPFLLGQQFTAADLYLASQIRYGLMFKTIEERSAFTAYVERCTNRPAFIRQQEQSNIMIQKLQKS